jgi:hypothetical protein
MHTPEGGVEVTQGLSAGDLLVVRGFEPLSEGAPVHVTDRTTLVAATSAADAGTAPPPASVSSSTPPAPSAHAKREAQP